MPEYLAPGVYVEEQEGIKTIEGVSTSTTGFAGVTRRGPAEGPQPWLRVFLNSSGCSAATSILVLRF